MDEATAAASTTVETAIAAVTATIAATDDAPDQSPDDGFPRWRLTIRSRIGIGDDRTGTALRSYKITIL